MDVVTHGLVGALVAAAVPGRSSWSAVAAAVGGALAPDLDVLARLWDPLAPITVHRTATHSLLGGLPLALGVAMAVKAWRPGTSLWALAALAYGGVLSHIALDLLTPFGTAVLWPLNSRRFALGWLYVIDPVVVAVVVAGLFASAWTRRRALAASVALAVLPVYALFAGLMLRQADAEFRHRLEAEGIPGSRVVMVPVFPGPVRWAGVADTGAAVYRARFWLGRRGAERLAPVAKALASPPLALDGLPEVRAFLAFARVPWRTVAVDGDTLLVEYRDLAFEDHPWGGPMALRVRMDRAGTVRTIDLGHKL